MNILSEDRPSYAPIQPTVSNRPDNSVSYQEYLPDIGLRNIIYCYWQLKTTTKLNQNFVHLVVADGCIDVYFELGNPQESYVMGFCEKHSEFILANSFNYVGVRFFPTMFPQLFKINAKEVSNKYEHLSNVLPDTSMFVKNNFDKHQDIHTIINLLDKYFLSLIKTLQFDNDYRLYQALKVVYKNYGILNMEKDLNTGLSQRQLRRVFEYYIGDTQKTFSKVVRFQRVLARAKYLRKDLNHNEIFNIDGYYDQTHFIKEFKKLYGLTPEKAFLG